MMSSEMKRLRELAQEHARLKKIVADLTLDREMLQDVIKSKAMIPGRKRELVDALRVEWANSIRRACVAIRFDPKTNRYKSRRPSQAALEQRIKEICQTRVRGSSSDGRFVH